MALSPILNRVREKLKFRTRLRNLRKSKFAKRFGRLILFLLTFWLIVFVGSKILIVKIVKCLAWEGVYSIIADKLPTKFYID